MFRSNFNFKTQSEIGVGPRVCVATKFKHLQTVGVESECEGELAGFEEVLHFQPALDLLLGF